MDTDSLVDTSENESGQWPRLSFKLISWCCHGIRSHRLPIQPLFPYILLNAVRWPPSLHSHLSFCTPSAVIESFPMRFHRFQLG